MLHGRSGIPQGRGWGGTPARHPRGRIRALTAAGAALLALALASPASAAPGDLDPSFGGTGQVTTDVGPLVDKSGSGTDEANAIAIDSSGRSIAAGFAAGSDGDLFAVVRYKTDGSVDKVFDTAPFCPGAHAQAIAIQSDGQIVVAGWAPRANDGCNGPNVFAL